MPRTAFPWPIYWMKAMYNAGCTLQEIADDLASHQWQSYWQTHLGREYRPGQKIVNKVLKRAGCELRSTGAPLSRNGNWKGGVRYDGPYVLELCPDHPHATTAGYVRKHRLVMEDKLGRHLLPTEVVHHKDDNPANNDPDNLELYVDNATHISQTMKGKVPPERIAKARQIQQQNLKRGSRYGRRITSDAQASPQTSDHSIA